MSQKRVVVIGAGPGGLNAAMILARHGCKVDVFEQHDTVGGRNAAIHLDGYTFDLGPTFLMMTHILEEMFELCGRSVHDYLDLRRLDPMYRLKLSDGREFFPSGDRRRMKEELARLFPGSWTGYQRYLEYEAQKLKRLTPCLQVPYQSLGDLLKLRLAAAIPYLDVPRSLYDHLGRYFEDEDLRLAFTFQAKYLGMSPWDCPALFSIISYLEHGLGIYHPIGGLNQISHALAKVTGEEGGEIHLGRTVEEVLVRGRRAVGVRLADGEEVAADAVVINADFGYAMSHLIPRRYLRKWTPEKLADKGLSCSTFMIYLGVKKTYPTMAHHSIVFAPDYRQNIREIAETYTLPHDPSFYVQNACVTDPDLAPEGCSTIYILVPVPNNRGGIDWEREQERYRDRVLELAEERGGYDGLRDHIVAERIISPRDFETQLNVYQGAVFNLAHSLDQMLIFRPHNQFEELDDCYLVGGGTHPGSGMPTILESARISAGLLLGRTDWFE